ncbi:MAG TPA: flagellar basal body rod C-terminal domain-containing protein [Candidatus Cybelea sp.]|jgi:flagellar basal body rod protein FlgG
MVAARTRLEIATENLANVSTDGFRRVDARGFLSRLGVTIERASRGGSGAVRATGRDLDFAIVGAGSFKVRDAEGRISETRAGAFVRDADGRLRDQRGRVVLGLHGALRVPAGGTIDPREFALPAGSRAQSGFLEGAPVDAIKEMIDVLAAERSFESAQKAVTAIDSTREKSAAAARVQ